MSDFQTNKKLNLLPLPYISMYDLDLIYQTSDVELLYQILSKVNEIAQSQNIIIDNFEKILDWANAQIAIYTKEQLQEWLDDGTLENMILSLGQVVKYFDTTEEMIKSQNLQVGQVIKTLGYNAINDGGSTIFRIDDEVDENHFQFSLGSGKYATVIDNVLKLKACGCDNTGKSDVYNVLSYINKSYNEVEISNGSYLLSTNMIINSHKKIHGNGTLILQSNIELTNYCKIENLTFTNKIGYIIMNGYYIKVDNIIINVDSESNGKGIYIYNANGGCEISNTKIEGNRLNFDDYETYGIYFSMSDENKSIINLIISDCYFSLLKYGISTFGTHNFQKIAGMKIVNNTVINCSNGIYMELSDHLRIDDNIIDLCYNPIYLKSPNGLLLINNYIASNKDGTIIVDIEYGNNSSNYMKINNNILWNSESTKKAGQCLLINSGNEVTIYQLEIIGNTCQQSNSGIFVRSNVTGCIIENNYIENCVYSINLDTGRTFQQTLISNNILNTNVNNPPTYSQGVSNGSVRYIDLSSTTPNTKNGLIKTNLPSNAVILGVSLLTATLTKNYTLRIDNTSKNIEYFRDNTTQGETITVRVIYTYYLSYYGK